MADDIIAEAIVRLEHKVDALLRHFKVETQPLHFPGQVCPSCKTFIDYQIDVIKGVVVRKCKCSTGKQAPTIPLSPIPVTVKDVKNGTTANSSDPVVVIGEATSKNNRRR